MSYIEKIVDYLNGIQLANPTIVALLGIFFFLVILRKWWILMLFIFIIVFYHGFQFFLGNFQAEKELYSFVPIIAYIICGVLLMIIILIRFYIRD